MASIGELLVKVEDVIVAIEKRPFDRFALAPFLIWYSLRSKSMGKLPRRLLLSAGIFQLIYAWREYQRLMGAVQSSPSDLLDVLQNKDVEVVE